MAREYITPLAGEVAQSPLRKLLAETNNPRVLQFGGGFPAPETFPIALLEQLTREVDIKYGPDILQYKSTEPLPQLQRAWTSLLQETGVDITDPSVLFVESGSQSILDKLGYMFIEHGAKIAVESPTYIGALQAFSQYDPEFVPLETDMNGVIPDSLEHAAKNGDLRMLYLVPTFQNPSGITTSSERRKMIADMAKDFDFWIVEDDPYSMLRYEGEGVAPIQHYAPEHTIYVTTLSKTIAPGYRLGAAIAPEEVRKRLLAIKGKSNLFTDGQRQAIAAEFIGGGHFHKHVPEIIKMYRERRDTMIQSIETYFPPGFTRSDPHGGIFLWVEYPEGPDMTEVLAEAKENNISFVPGAPFFAPGSEKRSTLRLNFSYNPPPKIVEGMEILGKTLTKYMK